MSRKRLMAASVAALLIGVAGSAKADVLFSFTGPTAEMALPSAVFAVFSAAGGPGDVSFRLDGYTSLDGSDTATDVFFLTLNGTDIFSGTWNMGGGGENHIYFGPVGATADSFVNGFFAGGHTDVFVPLNLAAGDNTLVWTYANDRPQGLADEGWGLETVVVHGAGVPGVPEPTAWALMLTGFAGLGAMMRRRRAVLA